MELFVVLSRDRSKAHRNPKEKYLILPRRVGSGIIQKFLGRIEWGEDTPKGKENLHTLKGMDAYGIISFDWYSCKTPSSPDITYTGLDPVPRCLSQNLDVWAQFIVMGNTWPILAC